VHIKFLALNQSSHIAKMVHLCAITKYYPYSLMLVRMATYNAFGVNVFSICSKHII
jgi:hypothetical protein